MYDTRKPVAEDNRNGVIGQQIMPVSGSDYAPSAYFKRGADPVLTSTVKNTAGNVISFYVTNANAAIRYLQFFDDTTTTAALMVAQFQIPATAAAIPGVVAFGADVLSTSGLQFSKGITYGISTTEGSYVAATNTEHTALIFYR